MAGARFSAWVAVGIGLVAVLAERAGADNFVVNQGNFVDDKNWDTGVAPAAPDAAVIDNGGTATIKTGDEIFVSYLQAGQEAGTTGSIVMTGGTVNVAPQDGDPGDNAVAIGEFGVGHFTMSGGTLNLGSLTGPDFDFHVGKSSMGSTMTMTGGTINLGSTFRVARGQDGNASATVTIMGGTLNTGSGIVVARGDSGDVNTADGTFIVGGTGKFIAGNSKGEGDTTGFTDEGFFSIGNRIKATGHVTVMDNGVIKSLRLTARQGHGDVTIQDNGQFLVVNNLGAGSGGLYNSYLGGGSNSNGDGPDGGSGVYSLALKGHGLLDVDANSMGRDTTRPDLQGFALARGNSNVTATIQDNAKLVVRQRFIIGGLGAHADFNGFDGGGDPGTDPGGTAVVTVTGGTISADHLIVGGTGTGTLTVSGGTVMTQPYASTYDPTGDNGNPTATESVNSIRIGMLTGSTGVINVSGNAVVSTGGDLSIGQYGAGTIHVTGGAASITARDVYVQKFTGSTGTVIAEITGPTLTPIQATNSVTIKGGTLQVLATAVPAKGAYLWPVLVANSGGGTGTLTGTFDTATLPTTPDPIGRKWSLLYDNNQVRVGLALPGDATFDGKVNFSDLVILAAHYNQSGAYWDQGDFNGDGKVGFDDLVLLASNYGKNISAAELSGFSPAFQSDVQQAFASVPEPGVAGLVIAMLGLRRRRGGLSISPR